MSDRRATFGKLRLNGQLGEGIDLADDWTGVDQYIDPPTFDPTQLSPEFTQAFPSFAPLFGYDVEDVLVANDPFLTFNLISRYYRPPFSP